MGFSCGIVGLPNVGKSTIFNALTHAGAAMENYPFCTIDPNVGIVPVPDKRLSAIAEIFKPQKVTPTTLEVVDIAGLVKGASQGEGLGNQFLSHIRQVQAILHVVRCFEDSNVVHVDGNVNPLRDVEVIHLELALSDLEAVQKRILRTEKLLKGGDKKAQEELQFLQEVKRQLEQGKAARELTLSSDQQDFLSQELSLLTAKPVLYVANISEQDLLKDSPYVSSLRKYAEERGSQVIQISGKIEAELSVLPLEEQKAFLKELGAEEPGLYQLIQAGYQLLNYITFFTAGEKEVRAWTIQKGTKAPQAAGVIHSDFERGFIRAETYHYEDLMKYKTEAEVRAKGLFRSEGKEYSVRDGDILLFRFNV